MDDKKLDLEELLDEIEKIDNNEKLSKEKKQQFT